MPYRVPPPSEPAGAPPPTEMEYAPAGPDQDARPRRRALKALLTAGVVAGLLCIVIVRLAGDQSRTGVYVVFALFAAFAVWCLWQWWRAPEGAGLVLRVQRGQLEVRPKRQGAALFTLPLAGLDDVLLDTKTISKVTMGNLSMPMLRHIDTKVGPELDIARIALIPEGKAPAFFLSEEYTSHQDALEAFARIRRFLRAHGWLPVDEREGDDEDVPASSSSDVG